MIDKNPEMTQAMKRAHKGDVEYYLKAQDAFLKQASESQEDHCPCTSDCVLHGDCKSCVMVHRAHTDHLPVCFRSMINDRIEGLSALAEHTFVKPR
jgi:hypothetical protein